MSREVDERVVSMQFDNKNFEQNVATTMSTLDKLKQKLDFRGASQGMQDLSKASEQVNMNKLSEGAEYCRVKFSALQIAATTCMTRIANSAYDAGEKLVKSLSVDNIASGWKKFGEKTTSVGTLVAQGYELEEVNKQLERLNWYTDETSYNFTDMVSNIAKFTATGKGLTESVDALQGIANWAALSGQNATTASRAMYQISQAMGAGVMRKEDYKSIQNASMDTDEFRQKALDAGVALGTLKKTGTDTYKSLVNKNADAFNKSQFAEHLTEDAWLTSEVMMKVFNSYSSAVDQIYDYSESKGVTASEAIEELGDKVDDFGLKAFKAAQEARTYGDAIDSVKDATATAWMNVFETIFGDYEEAKTLWTGLANTLYDVFVTPVTNLNELLEYNLGSAWEEIASEIEGAGVKMEDFENALTTTAKKYNKDLKKMIKEEGSLKKVMDKGLITKAEVVETLEDMAGGTTGVTASTEALNDKLKYFQKVVNEVWNGDYKNGKARVEALTKAGYNYNEVQALVNKTVDGHKLTLADLSEEQLKSVGYTEKEIKAIKELKNNLNDTTTSLGKLADRLGKMTGRELLLDTITKFGEAFSNIFDNFKTGWDSVFPDQGMSDMLYRIIEKVNELATAFSSITAEHADTFYKIGEALGHIWSIVKGGIGKSFGTAVKLFKTLLSLFNLDLMDVIDYICDRIIEFGEFIEKSTLYTNAVNKLAKIMAALGKGIKQVFDAFIDLTVVKNTITDITNAIKEMFKPFEGGVDLFNVDNIVKNIERLFNIITEWVESLESSENLGLDIVLGIAEGIKSAAIYVYESIINVGSTLIEKFKDFMGIHSPSLVFYSLGAYLILGLLEGLKGSSIQIFNYIGEFAGTLIDKIQHVLQNGVSTFTDTFDELMAPLAKYDIDWGALSVLGVIAGSFLLAKSALKTIEKLAEPFMTLKDVFKSFAGIGSAIKGVFTSLSSGIKEIGKSIEKYWKARTLEVRANAFLTLAKAILILVAALAVLTFLDQDKLKSALLIIGGLAAGLAALSAISSKMGTLVDVGKITAFIFSISASLMLLALAIKVMASINLEDGLKSILLIASSLLALGVVLKAYSKFIGDADNAGKNLSKVGWLFLKISAGMIIMAAAMKIMATIDNDDMFKVVGLLSYITLAFGLIIYSISNLNSMTGSTTADNISKVGNMMLKMAVSIGILAIAMKIIETMTFGEIGKAVIAIGSIAAIFTGVTMIISTCEEGAIEKAGNMFMKLGVTMTLLAVAMNLMSFLSLGDIAKGILVIGSVLALFTAFSKITKFSGKNADKAGTMLWKMAAAIAILAVAIKLFSYISNEDITKGMAVIAGCMVLFAGLVAVSKYAGKHASTAGTMLMKMSIALIITSAAIALISLLKPEDVYRGVAAVSVLMVFYAGLIAATKKAGKSIDMVNKMIISIGLLVAAVALLALIEPDRVVTATGALSALMISFGIMIAATKSMKVSKTATGTLVALGVMVAVLAGIVWALSYVDNIEAAIPSAIALGVLMNALATSMLVLSKAKKIKVEWQSFLTMGLTVLALATILGAMAYLNLEASIPSAIAIGLLLNALATSMLILSKTNSSNIDIKTVGYMAAIGLVIAELGVILGLLNKYDLQGSISTAIALGVLLNAMATAMFIISAIGMTGGIASLTAGIGAFMKFSAVVGVIIAVVGAVAGLVGYFDELLGGGIGESINTGLDILVDIANGIGRFFGAFAGGIAEGIMASTPAIGSYLSQFMENAQGFFDGIKDIDKDSVTAMGTIVDVVGKFAAINTISGLSLIPSLLGSIFGPLGIQLPIMGSCIRDFTNNLGTFSKENLDSVTYAASAIEALLKVGKNYDGQGFISKFLTGDDSLGGFTSQLPEIGENIAEFAKNLGNFDESKVSTIECAINAIKSLTETSNISSANSGLNFDLFGDKLPDIGTNISTFAKNLGTFSDAQIKSVTAAVDIIKTLVETGSSIAGQADWTKYLIGDNSLSGYVDELPDIATGIKKFATELNGIDKYKDAVECGMNALKDLVEAGSKVNGQADWSKDLFGDDSLSTYVSDLPTIGEGLAGFATKLGSFTEDNCSSVVNACKAIKELCTVGKEIDGQASWSKLLTGDDSLSTFTDELPAVGEDVASFVSKLGTLTTDQISYVETAVKIINSLTELGKLKLADLAVTLPNFSSKLPDFANDLKTFCSTVATVDGVNSSATLTSIVAAIKAAIADLNDYQDSFEKSATKLADAFIKGMNGKKDSMISAVKKLIDSSLASFSTKYKDTATAASQLVAKAIEAIETKKSSFESAGEDLVQGLINGLTDPKKLQEVYEAGKALGKKAVKGEKDGQNSASPSKDTIKAGKWLGEGLIIGMDRMGNAVYRAGEDMGSYASQSISNAVAAISRAVDSDIDSQPTIRPVLDLSDVYAGTNTLNNMLDMNPTMGVMANVKSINSMMNRRNQNGVNDDVVSAIKDLGASLGSGDTYNINGVSYSEGSDVGQAIKTLVQLVKQERRS